MLLGIDLELERLSFSWRFDQSSCYHVRRSHNRFFSLSESRRCFVNNNLQVVKAWSIVEGNENQVSLLSDILRPPTDSDLLSNEFLVRLPNSSDSNSLSVRHRCHWFLRHVIISIQNACVWLNAWNFFASRVSRGGLSGWSWGVLRESLRINAKNHFCRVVHF